VGPQGSHKVGSGQTGPPTVTNRCNWKPRGSRLRKVRKAWWGEPGAPGDPGANRPRQGSSRFRRRTKGAIGAQGHPLRFDPGAQAGSTRPPAGAVRVATGARQAANRWQSVPQGTQQGTMREAGIDVGCIILTAAASCTYGAKNGLRLVGTNNNKPIEIAKTFIHDATAKVCTGKN